MEKPKLSFWQIWNMSFGFLGIQFGFALQNANASRILQNFGADVHHLSLFWLAAPVTGLIVQPIVGHYSDRTWNKLGRRKPFFLVGATLASIALCFMPNSGALASYISPIIIGAGMLMVMDASFNISMEPFRALVADLLPSDQRTLGFSIQTALIGVGAVAGSSLPWVLANWFNVSNESVEGTVGDNVIYSFYVGGAVLILTILWTVIKTKEYPPEQMALYNDEQEVAGEPEKDKGLIQIVYDFIEMPLTMKQLGVTQFFSWFGLFSMWVFTTPAIAQHIYGTPVGDSNSATYQEAGDWVGIMFTVYNAVSAIYAILLPFIAKKLGRKKTHALSLMAGGFGLIGLYFCPSSEWLLLPMIGVGFAWASILAMPYAILAGSIPVSKMGIYMGIFNFFIVAPQILNGFIGGLIVEELYDSIAIYALVAAGVSFLIAAISVVFVKDNDEIVTKA